MSITFNTNTAAIDAMFNLNNIDSELATSVQRLSSGLQINSPADNPSGYVISNAFQVQVDSANTALNNNQTDTNLIKTATGALSQINSLLDTIRSSALDAAANQTIDPNAVQADQATITQAIAGIQQIAATTQFGNKNLLDGSAGISAAVTNSNDVNSITLGGQFAGGVTQAGNITISVTTAATAAQAYGGTHATYASVNSSISTVNGGTTGTGGVVNLNGQSINVSGSESVQTLLNQINNISDITGVSANYSSGNGSVSINLVQANYGANYSIDESETSPLVLGTAGANVAGVNAVATVSAQTSINGATSTQSETFTGGQFATQSGLTLTDQYGNSILLTNAGNATTVTNVGIGTASSNPLQFQLGPNAGDTASVAVNSALPTSLGATVVAGQNISTIDVTSATGANNAINIANAAITQIGNYQAQLGGFQADVLAPAANVLTNTVSNYQSTIGNIEDINVAQETTNFYNLQAIQQAGIQALKIADSQPSLFLSLLS